MPGKRRYPGSFLTIDPKLKEEVIERGKRLGLNFSETVSKALKFWLANEKGY